MIGRGLVSQLDQFGVQVRLGTGEFDIKGEDNIIDCLEVPSSRSTVVLGVRAKFRFKRARENPKRECFGGSARLTIFDRIGLREPLDPFTRI